MLSHFLFVANGRGSTGYAWQFINQLYADLGTRANRRGANVFIAYRELNRIPPPLIAVPVRPIELDAQMYDPRSIVTTVRFVRRHGIRTVYFSDRKYWSPVYTLLRLAGIRRVVVHSHTAGGGTRPGFPRRVLKRLRHMLPGSTADAVIAVSDFVAERVCEVAGVPRDRVHRVWNSFDPPRDPRCIRTAFGIEEGRPVIACASRAHDGKGVPYLMQAVEQVTAMGLSPVLVYFGDGPAMDAWRRVRQNLTCMESIIFAGYREDAPALLGSADIAVVPSTCPEAFGMAALEPMAQGVPVIASHVGGLPEVVGGAGLLVPPGNPDAMAAAIARLLRNGETRARFAEAGRRRASLLFSRREAIEALDRLILRDSVPDG